MAFKAGQEIYLTDGRLARYVAAYENNQHIVCPLVEDENDVIYEEEPRTVSTVFKTAPSGLYNKEIKQAQKDLGDLQKRAIEASKTLHEAEDAKRRQTAVFARVAALQRLEDFIEGRITHVLMGNYGGLNLQTLGEAIASTEDRWSKKFKLVSLYGNSNGDLQWRVNYYSDGSGSGNVTLVPFLSRESAVEYAVGLCNRAIKEWREKTHRQPTYWEMDVNVWSAVEFLEKEGLPVPEDVRAAQWAIHLEAAQKERDKLAKALADAEAKLAQVQG